MHRETLRAPPRASGSPQGRRAWAPRAPDPHRLHDREPSATVETIGHLSELTAPRLQERLAWGAARLSPSHPCLGFQPETEVLRVGPQERALCAGCGKPHGWGPRGVPTGRRGPIGDWGSCRKATPCTRKNSRATARGSQSPFPTSHLCPSPDTGCRASLPRPLWCHHNSTRRCLGNSPTVPLARCSGWWDPWVSADHTQDPPGRHAAGL